MTEKQMGFCQSVIEGMDASAAYRENYNAGKMKASSIHRNAKAVMDNTKVAARLADLRAEHAKRNEITVDSLVAELALNAKLAREVEQFGPSNAAILGKAKLLGLVIDRHQVEDVTDIKLSLNFGKKK